MNAKEFVPQSERLTGKELELAATYFAVSNMGCVPEMSPRGIYEMFQNLEREIQWDEDSDHPAQLERADWRKDLLDGHPYVYKEWPKIRELIKGLDRYLEGRQR